uniref:hypothetical protein n=1 Tax=uncultured Sphingomonas sp. TaxID=158754 RepID=UPI0035CAFACB
MIAHFRLPPPGPAPLPPSAAALLLLPLSVLAGGALFWPAACLAAIAAADARQHGAMLAWFGLAVGFDAQALLLAPFIVALLIGRRVSIALLPLAPLCAAATVVARAAAFQPVALLPQDLLLSHGAPNLWAIAPLLPWFGALPLSGLALACAFGSAAAYVAWFSARVLRGAALLDAALLCALVMPGLLPALDGRAFWLADALAVTNALLGNARPRWWIAALLVTGTLLACAGAALLPLAVVAMLLATALQLFAVLKPAANDNPLMPRTA